MHVCVCWLGRFNNITRDRRFKFAISRKRADKSQCNVILEDGPDIVLHILCIHDDKWGNYYSCDKIDDNFKKHDSKFSMNNY